MCGIISQKTRNSVRWHHPCPNFMRSINQLKNYRVPYKQASNFGNWQSAGNWQTARFVQNNSSIFLYFSHTKRFIFLFLSIHLYGHRHIQRPPHVQGAGIGEATKFFTFNSRSRGGKFILKKKTRKKNEWNVGLSDTYRQNNHTFPSMYNIYTRVGKKSVRQWPKPLGANSEGAYWKGRSNNWLV